MDHQHDTVPHRETMTPEEVALGIYRQSTHIDNIANYLGSCDAFSLSVLRILLGYMDLSVSFLNVLRQLARIIPLNGQSMCINRILQEVAVVYASRLESKMPETQVWRQVPGNCLVDVLHMFALSLILLNTNLYSATQTEFTTNTLSLVAKHELNPTATELLASVLDEYYTSIQRNSLSRSQQAESFYSRMLSPLKRVFSSSIYAPSEAPTEFSRVSCAADCVKQFKVRRKCMHSLNFLKSNSRSWHSCVLQMSERRLLMHLAFRRHEECVNINCVAFPMDSEDLFAQELEYVPKANFVWGLQDTATGRTWLFLAQTRVEMEEWLFLVNSANAKYTVIPTLNILQRFGWEPDVKHNLISKWGNPPLSNSVTTLTTESQLNAINRYKFECCTIVLQIQEAVLVTELARENATQALRFLRREIEKMHLYSSYIEVEKNDLLLPPIDLGNSFQKQVFDSLNKL